MNRFGAIAAIAVVFASAILVPSVAAASDEDATKERCLDAFVTSQRLRKASQYTKARPELVACLDPMCPELLRARCSQWLEELDASQPTFVVEARDANGRELAEGRIFVDDELVRDGIDGRAVSVDPGRHMIRVELPSHQSTSQVVVFREGERNRRLLFAPHAPSTPDRQPAFVVPTSAWVLAGVGALGTAGFTTFGLRGQAEERDLERTCSPRCANDATDAAHTNYLVADIALGAAILSVAAAVVVTVVTNVRRREASLSVRQTSGASGASILSF